MQRAAWLKQAIAAGNDFHYLKQTPWKHNLRNAIALSVVLSAYAGVLALGAVLPTWFYVPVGSLLIGSLFFGLFVLVIHECSHSMFVLLKDRERSKALNHAIGRVAGDLLFTDYMKHWAREHTVHHLQPTEDVDKQDLLRFSGPQLYKKYLQCLIPGAALKNNPSRQYGFSLRRTLIGLLFHGGIAAAAVVLVHWHVGLAILFGWNVTSALTMTKVAQEHGSGLATESDPYLRSRTYFYPSAKLTSPFNINYHFEHHANFNVPWYRLPAYHARVRELMPESLYPYYLTRGTMEFYQQLAGKRALPPAELEPLLRGTTEATA